MRGSGEPPKAQWGYGGSPEVLGVPLAGGRSQQVRDRQLSHTEKFWE